MSLLQEREPISSRWENWGHLEYESNVCFDDHNLVRFTFLTKKSVCLFLWTFPWKLLISFTNVWTLTEVIKQWTNLFSNIQTNQMVKHTEMIHDVKLLAYDIKIGGNPLSLDKKVEFKSLQLGKGLGELVSNAFFQAA